MEGPTLDSSSLQFLADAGILQQLEADRQRFCGQAPTKLGNMHRDILYNASKPASKAEEAVALRWPSGDTEGSAGQI